MSSKIGVENIAHTNGTNAMTISSGGVATFPNAPIGAFISVADQWRLTGSTNQGTNADVTSNWARVNNSGWGGIGISAFGLTKSSGVFSFATTGVYLIYFAADFFMTNNDGSASFELTIIVSALGNPVLNISTTGSIDSI